MNATDDYQRLPEWRFAVAPLGVDPLSTSGYYVRAENPTEARRKARRWLRWRGPNDLVDCRRWKEPGQ